MCLAFLLSYFGVSRIFPPRLAKTAEFTTEAKGQVRPTPQVYHVTMLNRCTRRSCWRWRYCITWDLRLNLRWACDFHLQWASKCMVFGRRSFFVRVIQVCWELSGDTWWEMWQEDSDAHEQRPNLNYKLYLQNLPRFFSPLMYFQFLEGKSCFMLVKGQAGQRTSERDFRTGECCGSMCFSGFEAGVMKGIMVPCELFVNHFISKTFQKPSIRAKRSIPSEVTVHVRKGARVRRVDVSCD